ncbi:phosphotransferase [Bifidobacterium sp. ESL0728]|uniref:phosphotransferase n=1 Tax=Bifidobacterium sp. ESL0728 TaxID=2983220 RepID=UPI0023F71A9A|nr:phosphotransferase [Bifidobacterium sp. ESL0728]WEV59331.1 phosphotransferase [Bifidobacterium sp. ESL0728]
MVLNVTVIQRNQAPVLSKKQFTTLNYLRAHPNAQQRLITAETGLSLGSVNTAIGELTDAGYIADSCITPAGLEALAPYKVDNAIIMAAGMSSRFAPISYEKPKGLLKVRGEILIEREIKQLQAAGIHDITVVVGYKKEFFFYLEQKFGVSIVINDEYATRNNNGTLWRVRDQLANTYICSSDNYFTINPFEPYVWKAYYAGQYSKGHTEEWCMTIGPHGRIMWAEEGGSDAWYMIGQAYFDRAFSQKFRTILETEHELPESTDKLWDAIYVKHIKELDMELRPYKDGSIYEFDSLDEVRTFDPDFLQNVDMDIFDNIERTLHCDKEEIHDVYPLKQGLTNLSCHFSTNSGEYVYRHPGTGTDEMINRRAEVEANETAKQLGLDPTFIYEDPERGWKISHFVDHARNVDPHDRDQVAHAMQIGRKLHKSGATVNQQFDFYTDAKRYEALLREKGPIDIPGFDEMAAQVERVAEYVRADKAPICLCHNDFLPLNFLIDENGSYSVIDWEFAGMGDYANDFGTFCVSGQLDENEVDAAMAAYFGRTPTLSERRHNYAHIQLAGWFWYVWALAMEAEGHVLNEWPYIYFRYATGYLDRTLELYEKDES